jgi:DNA polymerase II small subunit
MEKSDIIKEVMDKEYQISPQAVELIKSSNSPESLLKYILSTVNDSVIVIGTEQIDLEGFAAYENALKQTYAEKEKKVAEFISESDALPNRNPTQDPNSSSDMAFQKDSDTQLDDDLSEDASSSYSTSRSISPLKIAPESFCSPTPSQAGNKSAFSFFGRENSSPSSRITRSDQFLSISRKGPSRDEGYKHFPGKNPVTVISDISGHSTCIGEYMQFVQYFRDRYSRLSEIIRNRVNARPMESLKRKGFHRGRDWSSEEISIIGIVSEISNTTNGHKILSLEDPTGSFSVLIRNTDKELSEFASKILLDEVIGVTGTVTNSGNLMIASKIIQPDVPNNINRRTGSKGKLLLISDIHVGSSKFLEEAWLDFLNFLKGKSDSRLMRELAADIRYLVVAGDIVDGIGIYPDQEMELNILDVYDQYRKAAEYFREIPEHIRVIISPGNHDAVRQAEPQPALSETFRADFPQNVIFVGNPALLDLDGVRILVYHGRSIDDLVASIPGVSYQEPAGAVLEMVKRRHLAPTYGSRVSISPEKKDYFVIDPVPDIIHTGHVHTLGVQRYKNILLVNSGTWQAQTEFQKRVNLVPVPARIPIVDLADFSYKILTFD